VHGKPLTVAYISRDDPRTLTERAPVLQHFRHLAPDIIRFDLAAQGEQVLNDLETRWVVLDRYQMPAGEERSYTDATAAEIFHGQQPVYQDDRITVYEVAKPATAAPYLVLGDGWDPFDQATGTRSFQGSATVTVHAPAEDRVTVQVIPAPGSAPLDLPKSSKGYALDCQLHQGDNTIVLRALGASSRATIASLSLNSQNEEKVK
jgi:hypothetical protein